MVRIKAIPTAYNGRFYRSRLEARWAVFFDDIGIDYRYELEGFELANGRRYLPDFYFPKVNLFGEVKPFISAAELGRLDQFVKQGLRGVILLDDEPTFKPYLLLRHVYVSGAESEVSNACLDIWHKPKRYFEENRFYDKQAAILAKCARFEVGQTAGARL